MVKLLDSHGAEIDALDYDQMTPFYYAILSEKLNIVEYLLGRGANIEHKDCQDRTPFYWACCQSSVTVIKYLYSKGCDINAKSRLKRSPLSKAAYTGRADVVELLIGLKGIDMESVDSKNSRPLHNAVWGKTGGRDGKRVGSTQKEDCPEAA